MSKNILVVGGLGFIGSNLTDKLLKQGNLVYVIDDLSTGRYQNLTWLYRRNPEPTKEKRLKFLKCDITNVAKFSSIISKNVGWKLDQIYHLACPASPPKYYKKPLKTLDINYIGTKNILEIAKKFNSKILFTSTSEIYGDPEVHPQIETYNGNVNPISPRSVYDEGKRVAETLVSEYHRTYKLDTRIARIFNTYGPRMDPNDGRVVTNFIKQTLQGGPITIYGDGSQTRSFCYISDQVSGLIALMNSDLFINEPVNIGNPTEITIFELASHISRDWSEIPLEYLDLPISDPIKRKPDISKMKSIGWELKISLKEGIKKTTEYMKEEINL